MEYYEHFEVFRDTKLNPTAKKREIRIFVSLAQRPHTLLRSYSDVHNYFCSFTDAPTPWSGMVSSLDSFLSIYLR